MTKKTFELGSDDSESPMVFPHNGDRRLGIERRQFSYHLYIPERRSGKDRRSGMEQRKLSRFKIYD